MIVYFISDSVNKQKKAFEMLKTAFKSNIKGVQLLMIFFQSFQFSLNVSVSISTIPGLNLLVSYKIRGIAYSLVVYINVYNLNKKVRREGLTHRDIRNQHINLNNGDKIVC